LSGFRGKRNRQKGGNWGVIVEKKTAGEVQREDTGTFQGARGLDFPRKVEKSGREELLTKAKGHQVERGGEESELESSRRKGSLEKWGG